MRSPSLRPAAGLLLLASHAFGDDIRAERVQFHKGANSETVENSK